MQLPVNLQSNITLNKVRGIQVQKGRSSIHLLFPIPQIYVQTYFVQEGSEEARPSGDNRTVWEELNMDALMTSTRGNEGGKKQPQDGYSRIMESASPSPSFSCQAQQTFPLQCLWTFFLSLHPRPLTTSPQHCCNASQLTLPPNFLFSFTDLSPISRLLIELSRCNFYVGELSVISFTH